MTKKIQKFFGDHVHLHALAITLITAVALFLCLYLYVETSNSIKENKYIGRNSPAMDILPVVGKGEVTVVPNIAEFSLSILEKAQTAADAQKKATEKNNKVIAFLKENGVEEKDIKTTGYNIYPNYSYESESCVERYCPPSEGVITSYEVNQNVSVRVKDIDKASFIIGNMGPLAVSNVSGLNFTIENEDELKRQARNKAIADAQTQAQEIAQQLNIRLGKVVSFNVSSPGYMPYYSGRMEMDMKAQSVDVPTLETGENKITSEVVISYEIQ
jgi:uncharacterized protein YggE